MHVRGIFCDLAKAFDCVDHEIFLAKLRYYDIQGTVANCFRFYLTNRKQKTEIKSFERFSSKWGTVKTWSSPRVNFRAFAFHNVYN
jgi:hypothetical protein